MMYSVTIDGRMPFVDPKSYREQQIKRVVQKHRAKRQREGDRNSSKSAYDSTSHPMTLQHPVLHRLNNSTLIDTHKDLPSALDSDHHITKRNILHAIKKWFSNTSKSSSNTDKITEDSAKPYEPRFKSKSAKNRSSSAPMSIAGTSRKTALNSNSPPTVSPKRQRRRTVSNIGSIMETIEEIPENFVLEDESDSSDAGSIGLSSTSSINGLQSVEGSLSSLLSEHQSLSNSSLHSSSQLLDCKS